MTATVLLPVHNGARTLRLAVDSILAQDDPDFELLIIDDASTDPSAEIAESYAAADARVTVVRHRRNAGLASTLNEGLERARYELVARMDQDDESLPARLRIQCAFLEAHPEVAAAGSWVLHMGAQPKFDNLIELPETPRGIAERLQHENCLYHPSVMMRRSVILGLGGYRREFRNAEDYDLWLRLSRDHDLGNVAEPLLRYRFSLEGMTLGRKWEQLYYVHLAQAVNGDTSMDLAAADAHAREMLATISRRRFFAQVAQGTVSELVRLRHWSDALKLSIRFGREIGPAASSRLIAFVGREKVRSWREA